MEVCELWSAEALVFGDLDDHLEGGEVLEFHVFQVLVPVEVERMPVDELFQQYFCLLGIFKSYLAFLCEDLGKIPHFFNRFLDDLLEKFLGQASTVVINACHCFEKIVNSSIVVHFAYLSRGLPVFEDFRELIFKSLGLFAVQDLFDSLSNLVVKGIRHTTCLFKPGFELREIEGMVMALHLEAVPVDQAGKSCAQLHPRQCLSRSSSTLLHLYKLIHTGGPNVDLNQFHDLMAPPAIFPLQLPLRILLQALSFQVLHFSTTLAYIVRCSSHQHHTSSSSYTYHQRFISGSLLTYLIAHEKSFD